MTTQCWVCSKILKRGRLCVKHKRSYIYRKEFDFVSFKGRRKISQGQQLLYISARKIFRKRCYQEVVFDWNHCRRFDIVVPALKVILEADGRQHDSFVPFFHKTFRAFKTAQATDKIKEDMAMANGWAVIRFNHKQLEDIQGVEARIRQIKRKYSTVA